MEHYPVKSYDADKGIIEFADGAGSCEVEVLREEVNLQWNTDTILCKTKRPFVLYNGETEYYSTEYNYILFQKMLSYDRVDSTAILYEKPKTANKDFISRISRQDVD